MHPGLAPRGYYLSPLAGLFIESAPICAICGFQPGSLLALLPRRGPPIMSRSPAAGPPVLYKGIAK
jgi:hypothetical protein